MAKQSLQVGVLISTSGSYGTVGKTINNGVNIAAQELRVSKPEIDLNLTFADPGSSNADYVRMARQMLDSGVRHIIGCYTSSSRKEILHLIERYEALLWYPTHYEGFEGSDCVVYTGTSPNHHIHPMVDYMHTNHGNTAFCIGSDYIWAWESNRVFKDEFTNLGGTIQGEQYIPIDSLDMAPVIDQILECKPSFILNTLIGASSYKFFREFRKKCELSGINQPKNMPIVSCNLSEADLREIGTEAASGHFSSSVYFASVSTPENTKFVQEYIKQYPNECLPTVEAEAAYIATHFLAAGLDICRSNQQEATVAAIKKAALNYSFNAPQGLVRLDPVNFHTYLTPRIGRSNSQGSFDIVTQAALPVRPDPYLVWTSHQRTQYLTPEQIGA